MAFREDIIPECRSTAHPPHTDKRRWMVVVREEPDYVVWCCQRCTEITRVYAIQVQILPRGKERSRHLLGRQAVERHRVAAPRLALPADVRGENEKPEAKSFDEVLKEAAKDPDIRRYF